MDAFAVFLDRVKRTEALRGQFLGLLHVLIGRRIATTDGKLISTGHTWRDLAAYFKKGRWDIELAEQLALNREDLPPRDRQRYWYSVILRAGVDSPAARAAGDRVAEQLEQMGFRIGSAPGVRAGRVSDG